MNTANQMMAVGCIMILFALTVGIVSVLHQHHHEAIKIELAIQQDIIEFLQVTHAMDTLYEAIHYAVCTMKQIHWSSDHLLKMINETALHAVRGVNSTNCPMHHI